MHHIYIYILAKDDILSTHRLIIGLGKHKFINVLMKLKQSINKVFKTIMK